MSDTAIAAPRRRRLSPARQAGIALVLAWAALAAFGPYLAPYRAGDVVNVGVFAPMSAAHPFGTRSASCRRSGGVLPIRCSAAPPTR